MRSVTSMVTVGRTAFALCLAALVSWRLSVVVALFSWWIVDAIDRWTVRPQHRTNES
jgi:hypothetical protein